MTRTVPSASPVTSLVVGACGKRLEIAAANLPGPGIACTPLQQSAIRADGDDVAIGQYGHGDDPEFVAAKLVAETAVATPCRRSRLATLLRSQRAVRRPGSTGNPGS
jgi:hypothetical protein